MKRLHKISHGFTIIELLIATLVVSMLLLLCVYGLAQVSRFFTKGVTSATTQDVTRTVLEDVVGRIQVEQNQILDASSSSSRIYCIGTSRYKYNYASGDLTDKAITLVPGARMLSRDVLASVPVNADECRTKPVIANSQTNLLKDNMRAVDFTISQPPGTDGRLYNVSLKVLYAPDDAALADIVYLPDPTKPDDVRCSGVRGSEFCGMSSLSTTVFRFNECTYCAEGS